MIKNFSDNNVQNEYGLSAWKAIIGCEILNTGGGLSVDDITNETSLAHDVNHVKSNSVNCGNGLRAALATAELATANANA